MHTHTVHTHLGGGRVTLLADPAISCLLGGFLQWGVQTPEVIAELALVTPVVQTGRACVTPHINKLPSSYNDEASSGAMTDEDKAAGCQS